MRRNNPLAFIGLTSALLFPAIPTAGSQQTNNVAVFGCPDVTRAKIVIGGDETLTVTLKEKEKEPDGVLRGTWLGDEPLPENPCGSLRFKRGRTYIRCSSVQWDKVFNAPAAIFVFDCNQPATRDVTVGMHHVPARGPVSFTYCRDLEKSGASGKDRSIFECGIGDTERPIEDWRLPEENVRLLIFSTKAIRKGDFDNPGLLLNTLEFIQRFKDGALMRKEMKTARCKQHLVDRRALVPNLASNGCELFDKDIADLSVTLKFTR